MNGPLTTQQITALSVNTPAFLWRKDQLVERVRCVGQHEDPGKGIVAHLDFWPEGFGLFGPPAMLLRSTDLGTRFEIVPGRSDRDWKIEVWGPVLKTDDFQVFATEEEAKGWGKSHP